MQLFGDIVILSLVRRSRLNWIGRVNRMDSKRKYVKNFPTIFREVDQVDDQKAGGGTVYKRSLINAKLKTGKIRQETELTGRSPLRRRKSALDCSAI
jgi:hypothetical protein